MLHGKTGCRPFSELDFVMTRKSETAEDLVKKAREVVQRTRRLVQKREKYAEDLKARILQHEIDLLQNRRRRRCAR